MTEPTAITMERTFHISKRLCMFHHMMRYKNKKEVNDGVINNMLDNSRMAVYPSPTDYSWVCFAIIPAQVWKELTYGFSGCGI